MTILDTYRPLEHRPTPPNIAKILARAEIVPCGDRGRPTLSRRSAPTDEERADLNRRLAEVRSWLKPADSDWIAGSIAALSLAMRSQTLDREQWRALLRIYVTDLGDLPKFAIEKATEAYRRGEIGDGRWLPTPGELRVVAKRHVGWMLAEVERIERLLSVQVEQEPRSEESRSRMLKAFADLKSELTKAPDLHAPRCVREPQAASAKPRTIDEIAADYRATPVRFSDPARFAPTPDWRKAA